MSIIMSNGNTFLEDVQCFLKETLSKMASLCNWMRLEAAYKQWGLFLFSISPHCRWESKWFRKHTAWHFLHDTFDAHRIGHKPTVPKTWFKFPGFRRKVHHVYQQPPGSSLASPRWIFKFFFWFYQNYASTPCPLMKWWPQHLNHSEK